LNPDVPPTVVSVFCFAARVRSVHVIITDPAGKVEYGARVIVITSDENFEVASACDEVMEQRLSPCAVTYPDGKVSVI